MQLHSEESPYHLLKRFWEWSGLAKKTLWDIVQFFVIFIPVATFVIEQRENNRIREDDYRQKILSDYVDQMTKFLLEDNLRQAPEGSEVLVTARVETLSTARHLDGERKGELLEFLYRAGLIGQCQNAYNSPSFSSSTKSCERSILDLSDTGLNEIYFGIPIPLPGIDLTGTSLAQANLSGIDLRSAEMRRTKLMGANLTGALLSGAQMEIARLEDATLIKTILADANLKYANLKGADLEGAVLRDADLNGAELHKANLNNADLRGADLRDANLTEASLQGSDLREATYNEATNFPSGFNPQEQGMIQQ